MANQLYNQCRVYCAPWRLDALNLNDIIDQWIDDGLLPPLIHTFLPYRDDAGASSEEEILLMMSRIWTTVLGLSGILMVEPMIPVVHGRWVMPGL